MGLKSTHKRKKYSRAHGKNMGTAGTGCRKNKRKSGHKGGCGMAGSGKRADHKKTLLNKLYGNNYFGKQGVTSRGTRRDTLSRMNVGEIQSNLEGLTKKGIAVKGKEGISINLSKHKVLGTGEVKDKFVVTALAASKTAIEKIEAAGGKFIVKVELKEKLKKYERAAKKVKDIGKADISSKQSKDSSPKEATPKKVKAENKAEKVSKEKAE